jgi:hypothetical protein
MRKIICQKCGKTFQIDDDVQKAFCVHCGAANELSGAESGTAGIPADQTVELDAQQQVLLNECRQKFESARFKVFNRKTGEKGDTMIGFWSTLLFHGRNSRGFFSMNRARREADKYWQQPVIAQALSDAGDLAEMLVAEQLYDSVKRFYKTCKEDRHYGTKLLDMMKLKPDQIADKVAKEFTGLIFEYWLHFEQVRYRDQIFRAAWHAYPVIFPDYPDLLRERVNNLPVEEYQELRKILRF